MIYFTNIRYIKQEHDILVYPVEVERRESTNKNTLNEIVKASSYVLSIYIL